MEIRIIEKRENPLLDRIEVLALAEHPNQATPRREEVRKRIAALLGVSEDLVVVKKIVSVFGWPRSRIYVNVYKNKEAMFRLEPKHILKRNGIIKE